MSNPQPPSPLSPSPAPASKSAVAVAEPEVQTFVPVTPVTVKPITIDAKDVPKETTQDKLPTKPYWGGVKPGAPFDSVTIGHITFQKTSFNLVGGVPANPKIGMLMNLTEEQLKKIVKQSQEVAWRRLVTTRKVGKEVKTITNWERVDLRSVNERLMPGDKLTAHFAFLAELPRGGKPPVGVIDEDGNPLSSPDPLIKS